MGPKEPQALPDTVQGQQPVSGERGRPRPWLWKILPPPSVLQLVLQGIIHKGHGCVHKHECSLSPAARGGRLGWGAGASLAPANSKLYPLVAHT